MEREGETRVVDFECLTSKCLFFFHKLVSAKLSLTFLQCENVFALICTAVAIIDKLKKDIYFFINYLGDLLPIAIVQILM